MKFAIEGADAKTGKERRIEVDADDEHSALAQAKAVGIFPTSASAGDRPESTDSFIPFGEPRFRSGPAAIFQKPAGWLLILVFAGLAYFFVFGFRGEQNNWDNVNRNSREPQNDRPVGERNFREGEHIWLRRKIVGARDLDSLRRVAETMRDNDVQAFAVLISRGDAVQLEQGTRVTVSRVEPGKKTFLSVRPEGSPDELWVFSVWLAD